MKRLLAWVGMTMAALIVLCACAFYLFLLLSLDWEGRTAFAAPFFVIGIIIWGAWGGAFLSEGRRK